MNEWRKLHSLFSSICKWYTLYLLEVKQTTKIDFEMCCKLHLSFILGIFINKDYKRPYVWYVKILIDLYLTLFINNYLPALVSNSI